MLWVKGESAVFCRKAAAPTLEARFATAASSALSRWRKTIRGTISSELFGQFLQKRLNRVFVAFEKMPLPMLLAGDQPGTLQLRQVGRNRRLRKARALVDLTGADTAIKGVLLIGEAGRRVFEPGKDLPPNRVRQGFYYLVEVDRHVVLNVGVAVYRDGANHISINRDIQI